MAHYHFDIIVPAFDEEQAGDTVSSMLDDYVGQGKSFDYGNVDDKEPILLLDSGKHAELSRRLENLKEEQRKAEEILDADYHGSRSLSPGSRAYYHTFLGETLYEEFGYYMPYGYFDMEGFSYYLPSWEDTSHEWGRYWVVSVDLHA